MIEAALKISRAELVPYKKRKGSLVGFRVVGAIEHLRDHLLDTKDPWCEVGCMARTMFGRDCESNRAKIRRSIRVVFHTLLEDGTFLVISYDAKDHGKIASCKIYEGLENEQSHAFKQLERMHRRKQLTDELLKSAKALVSG